MTRGILIIAHNNSVVDYISLAEIAASLAKKHLKLPVSILTDKKSFESLKDYQEGLFDKVVIIDQQTQYNPRVMYNQRIDDFLNSSRSQAWEHTPYDHTLLIDSDLLIFSDRFNQYWDLDESFLICDSMIDPIDKRLSFNDRRISDIGPELKWATAIMFKKDERAKTLFQLVDHIFENYSFYADTYFFDDRQFRNDIAFALAEHIIGGFIPAEMSLPPLHMTMVDDEIVWADSDKIKFLIKDNDSNLLITFENTDIHVMNKLDILKYKKNLLS